MQYRDHHTTGDVRSEEDEERICETDISSMPWFIHAFIGPSAFLIYVNQFLVCVE